jgi:poly(3-hydroxybutyrate) depolymerase
MRRSGFAVAALILSFCEAVYLLPCATAVSATADPILNFTAGEVNEGSIEYGGIGRKFLYYVPNDFNLKAKHPLIFILHGFNQPVETIVSGYSARQPGPASVGIYVFLLAHSRKK